MSNVAQMAKYTAEKAISKGTQLNLLELDTPMRPRGVLDLPDEILLNIMKRLPRAGTYVMALVSKRFYGVAQEQLYHAIVLKTTCLANDRSWSKNRGSRVGSLFRTLCTQTTLALKVRELLVYPTAQEVRFNQDDIPGFSLRDVPISRGVPVQVRESALVGYLLAILPNLQLLDVGIYKGPDRLLLEAGKFSPLLFGREATTTSVPGLAGLRELILHGGTLENSWLSLPRLASVHIGIDVRLRQPGEHTSPSKVTTVSLTVRQSNLDSWHYNGSNLVSWIALFPHLQTLKIVMRVYNGSQLWLGKWAILDTLLDKVSQTLEHLQISLDQPPHLKPHVWPICSMRSLAKLRTLEIYQDALLGECYGDIFGRKQEIPVANLCHQLSNISVSGTPLSL